MKHFYFGLKSILDKYIDHYVVLFLCFKLIFLVFYFFYSVYLPQPKIPKMLKSQQNKKVHLFLFWNINFPFFHFHKGKCLQQIKSSATSGLITVNQFQSACTCTNPQTHTPEAVWCSRIISGFSPRTSMSNQSAASSHFKADWSKGQCWVWSRWPGFDDAMKWCQKCSCTVECTHILKGREKKKMRIKYGTLACILAPQRAVKHVVAPKRAH